MRRAFGDRAVRLKRSDWPGSGLRSSYAIGAFMWCFRGDVGDDDVDDDESGEDIEPWRVVV